MCRKLRNDKAKVGRLLFQLREDGVGAMTQGLNTTLFAGRPTDAFAPDCKGKSVILIQNGKGPIRTPATVGVSHRSLTQAEFLLACC